jgi:hypothetical protein
MRALPHDGLRGKNCPQCGQGLQWKKAIIESAKRSMVFENIRRRADTKRGKK